MHLWSTKGRAGGLWSVVQREAITGTMASRLQASLTAICKTTSVVPVAICSLCQPQLLVTVHRKVCDQSCDKQSEYMSTHPQVNSSHKCHQWHCWDTPYFRERRQDSACSLDA